MRLIYSVSVTISLVLLFLPRASGGCPPQVIACTADNAAGSAGYNDSVTDLTYRAGLNQVWAIEGPLPSFNGLTTSRITVFSGDLKTKLLSPFSGFTDPAFGIAEIPDGLPNAGKCYVLTPYDNANGVPAIGIMEDNGSLLSGSGFIPVIDPRTQSPPDGFYAAIDVHPSLPEIALYDFDIGRIVFVAPPNDQSQFFTVVRGPFTTEGLPLNFGGGITYNSETTVLVLSQFRTAFEGHLALEYNTGNGQYTGNSIVLDHPDSASASPLLPIGLDTGLVGSDPAIFLYNAMADAIYAVPFDIAFAPGPVENLNFACAVEPDGRVRLHWKNNPAYGYDQILVHENGVVVDRLIPTPGDQEYRSPVPARGKYEYCLETLLGGGQSVLRVCCEGQSGAQLPFLPSSEKPGSEVIVDPLPLLNHFQLGMACPKVVEKKEDFRLYIIGTYDNKVRVVDSTRKLLPESEWIVTNPPLLSTVQGGYLLDIAATGIALIDLTIDGQKVPMYALLDGDGPDGNYIPEASIHFLKDTTLPGSETPVKAGSMYKTMITNIDRTNFGQGGVFMYHWDSDDVGDLITVDSEGQRILKIHYDPETHTMAVVAEAPLPMKDIPGTPLKNFPLGGITVLPSGYYLLAGDTVLDSTVVRAYFLTPFDSDPNNSVKNIGPVDGLWSFSQFYPYEVIGRKMGPDSSYGFESTYFRQEGVGAMFSNLPHLGVTPRLTFKGNILMELTTSLAHPDLKAERLFDDTATMGPLGSFGTGPLPPSFSAATPKIDFHYHIFNPAAQGQINLKVHVLVEGLEIPELVETIRVPAGRGLYRVAGDRAEKSVEIQVENLDSVSEQVRILVGATGVKVSKEMFRRGDADASGSSPNITDVQAIVQFMFFGFVLSCQDAADVDDNGAVDVTDAIDLLAWMYLGTFTIPPPGPETCGPDPTDDLLPPCIYPCGP